MNNNIYYAQFKGILLKKLQISHLKNLFILKLVRKLRKFSLSFKNQSVNRNNYHYITCNDCLEKHIIQIIKQRQKFLTADELFSILLATQDKLKFDLHDIYLSLHKIKKEKIIYEYRHPELNCSLWGNALHLDKNMIPKEDCIDDKYCKEFISQYKGQILR